MMAQKTACANRTADLLDFDARFEDGHTVVEIGGYIDLRTCGRLRENLLELSDRGHCLLAMDMSGVDFMDSSGLGVLVGARKRAVASGGMLVLVNAPDRVVRVLRITGLTKVFPLFETLGEALEHFAS